MNLRTLLAGAVAGFLAIAGPAHADLILVFGQNSGTNTISATAGAAGTTWGGTDVAVTITQIGPNGPATPLQAFLDVTASSTDSAQTIGGLTGQRFAGTFSVNSLANNTGVNYLSGPFNDGALTAIGATGIAVFAADGLFSSDVILALGEPLNISFGLTNVTPAVSLLACATCATGGLPGQTINSFTASVAGDASATLVPEPATMALFGAGLLALGLIRRRRGLAA